MRVGSRARNWSAGRSCSYSDGDEKSRCPNCSGDRLDGLGHSLNFWSSRAGRLPVDIDDLVGDFAANDLFLGIGEGRSVCDTEGGEGD
jgi:hypothetical protein